ncbi:suppressor of fused domain protein [Sphingobacterium daejeonense]|uniref:Suppressor of fused domain protein n=1 Tax=Sphingobacterium daejeonense TaxID=371142 RepID=A0ABW3RKM3_9SPHI
MELGRKATPHGEVSFIQLVGITQNELDYLNEFKSVEKVAAFLEDMKKDNPFLVTDLNRK